VLLIVAIMLYVILLPSMTWSVRFQNQTDVSLDVYLIDFQTKTMKKIVVEPGAKKHMRLCSGDDIESLFENAYVMVAVDEKGKVWLHKYFKVKDYPKREDRLFIIKEESRVENSLLSNPSIFSGKFCFNLGGMTSRFRGAMSFRSPNMASPAVMPY